MKYPKSTLPSLHQQTTPSELEIACGFDGLTSLDEFAPGMDWENLLSATWGLPVANQQPAPVKKVASPTLSTIVRGWFSFGSAY
jgi:hypothetical protein